MLSLRSLRRDEELRRLAEENARLREQNCVLLRQAESASAHANIAKWHLNRIQEELNRKTTTKKCRRIRSTAALITAGEGAMQCERQEREAAEREAWRRAEQERRAEEERRRQVQRKQMAYDNHIIFSGTLSRKVKEDLKDIAFALGLPINGTNSDLSERIADHLRLQAAQYSSHPKFSGLYTAANGLSGVQKRPLPPDFNDENSLPPSSRRRLDPGTSSPALQVPTAPLYPAPVYFPPSGLHAVNPPLYAAPSPCIPSSTSEVPIDPALLHAHAAACSLSSPQSDVPPRPPATPPPSDRLPLSDISPTHTPNKSRHPFTCY
ncbi:hypothetical protein BN946_scf184797.g10 [Trametes cinnabarina]|uniref:SAP domain-containing protein n=1 Tax=Pycnoporus cinnabarinus TaxID=5643 RepID=A0A060T0X8_PYCCI|nr:hypothetical protein BN946_scf184797.g10 [Trametes cinnabarina]